MKIKLLAVLGIIAVAAMAICAVASTGPPDGGGYGSSNMCVDHGPDCATAHGIDGSFVAMPETTNAMSLDQGNWVKVDSGLYQANYISGEPSSRSVGGVASLGGCPVVRSGQAFIIN